MPNDARLPDRHAGSVIRRSPPTSITPGLFARHHSSPSPHELFSGCLHACLAHHAVHHYFIMPMPELRFICRHSVIGYRFHHSDYATMLCLPVTFGFAILFSAHTDAHGCQTSSTLRHYYYRHSFILFARPFAEFSTISLRLSSACRLAHQLPLLPCSFAISFIRLPPRRHLHHTATPPLVCSFEFAMPPSSLRRDCHWLPCDIFATIICCHTFMLLHLHATIIIPPPPRYHTAAIRCPLFR